MREAQLDIAEEFDLLIVIICSSCSVAKRISKKRAGAEIVFMLLLYCFSNCLKTWVFSLGSNNACYFVRFLVHSRARRPRSVPPQVWVLVFWGVFCLFWFWFSIQATKKKHRVQFAIEI